MQVDETSGFKTKTILCMPIQNSNGEIMGVVQLLNKMDNTPFNANDENLFEVNKARPSRSYRISGYNFS